MPNLRRRLPLDSLILLGLVGLILGCGTPLHHLLPHHDDDEDSGADGWACSLCKITENNPAQLTLDAAVHRPEDGGTHFPSPRLVVAARAPTAVHAPRAPPTFS